MHSSRAAVPWAALLVAIMVVLSSAGAMGRVGRLDHDLPLPVAMACAVYTGTVVYVFGGATEGDLLDTIYAVDPETGRATELGYRLPYPRKMASAVWTGREAYIIGGIGFDAEPIAEIVRFVPGEGVTVVEGAMPYGTRGIPSFWDGEHVHVIGNCLSSGVGHHDVIRFDPENGSSEILEDVLPIPGAGSSAVWAGDRAYIVGGRHNISVLSDRIVEYIPGQGTRFVEGRLPQGRIGAACAWDGERLYAFGGTVALLCGPFECVPIDYLDEIVVYDPVNDTCQLSECTLPWPMDLRAAVFTPSDGEMGDRVLIPGGLSKDGPEARLTVYYVDPPDGSDGPSWLPTLLDWTFGNRYIIMAGIAVVVLSYLLLIGPHLARSREERDARGQVDPETEE